LAAQIGATVENNGLERSDVAALLAAHGNRNNPQNARQAKALARAIADNSNGIAVKAAFIEEPPLISDWQADTDRQHLIVLPFLIGGGLHGAEDVPKMVGLDPEDPALGAMGAETPVAGPFAIHGRSIWYCRALGHDPALSRMIIDLVEASA